MNVAVSQREIVKITKTVPYKAMYQLSLSVHVYRVMKGRSVKQISLTSPRSKESMSELLVYERKTHELGKMVENKEIATGDKVQVRTSLKYRI